jgi:hypothetical protein
LDKQSIGRYLKVNKGRFIARCAGVNRCFWGKYSPETQDRRRKGSSHAYTLFAVPFSNYQLSVSTTHSCASNFSSRETSEKLVEVIVTQNETNCVALSPQENYTD